MPSDSDVPFISLSRFYFVVMRRVNDTHTYTHTHNKWLQQCNQLSDFFSPVNEE